VTRIRCSSKVLGRSSGLNCYQQPDEQTMRVALERRAMAASGT
jgi:hypothetical protein